MAAGATEDGRKLRSAEGGDAATGDRRTDQLNFRRGMLKIPGRLFSPWLPPFSLPPWACVPRLTRVLILAICNSSRNVETTRKGVVRRKSGKGTCAVQQQRKTALNRLTDAADRNREKSLWRGNRITMVVGRGRGHPNTASCSCPVGDVM